MSGLDVDEFAAYDFSEFTGEELAQIDAEIARKYLPNVPIAYETPNAESSSSVQTSSSKRQRVRDSPLDLFRSHGVLSVTDLVSPAWCEVQFEYGLRGKRSRPLHRRPRAFKSTSGKEIKTDTAIAAKNDVITSKGKAIHKSLEREVKAEETVVEITTAEERWALRLVNMLACLKGMQIEGMTREMPVFGIEDGEVVVGIIDELVYRPISHGNHDGTEVKDPSRTRLEVYFPVSGCSTDTRLDLPVSFTLQIIDTKTRQRPSLPLYEDTIPSRLQLMLYHRLLSRLVSPEPSFDFLIFWQLANVDPAQPLSWKFLQQAGLIADKDEFQVLNLGDLSVLWHDLIHQLAIAGVDEQLKLVYRQQLYNRRRGVQSVAPVPDDTSKPAETISSENGMANEGIVAPSSDQKRVDINTADEVEGHKGEQPIQQTVDGSGEKQHQVLGTKVFPYDPEFLSAHLVSILAWWRAERPPKGVPMELARRCSTCEYCHDCEWREERAREFREQAELNKETSVVINT
ncbi:hypothetical protein P691DRAFT_699478 [Macrolepiota fuliginosa MF-IS2]|uniref:Exonuclease V n=1 Tax=Macrolepiota fuliginosa MF-IS2 TaxID=1400762 RepID=A0A9P6C451_9AGAR|nr:hypothetical protein P691DRAFT_699478 [Macrolepiota fuliginosa MF-IS2]